MKEKMIEEIIKDLEDKKFKAESGMDFDDEEKPFFTITVSLKEFRPLFPRELMADLDKTIITRDDLVIGNGGTVIIIVPEV